MTFTLHDGGRKAPVCAGAEIVLRLAENPTTGVRWQLPQLDGLELKSDDYETADTGVGAAATRVLRFRVTGEGLIDLHMIRAQEWSPTDSQDASFDLQLDVTGSCE